MLCWTRWKKPFCCFWKVWKVKSVWMISWTQSLSPCTTTSSPLPGLPKPHRLRNPWENGWGTCSRGTSNILIGLRRASQSAFGFLDCTTQVLIWQRWSKLAVGLSTGHWIRPEPILKWLPLQILQILRRSLILDVSCMGFIWKVLVGILMKAV